jgi:hypothetical protein
LVLILGVVVVGAVVVGAVLASGLMNLRDLGGGGEPSASAGPSTTEPIATESAEPSADASVSAAPTIAPPEGGAWAAVLAETVNIRSAASLDSALLGNVTVGQLVYLHSSVPTREGARAWYEVQAAPGLGGWVVGVDGEMALLNLDGPSGTVEWCAVPSERVYPVAEYEPRAAMVLGDLPLSSSQFSAAALGTADIAWADGTQTVCAVLDVVDGAAASATFHADIDTCAKPRSGAYGWGLDYGGGAVAPNGEEEEIRYILISNAVLGYSQMNAARQNADQIVHLAGAGSSFGDLVACMHVSLSGGVGDTEISATVRADVCATVVSVDSDHVVVRGVGGWDTGTEMELALNPGSEIDPSIEPGTTLGMLIETDRGVDAAIRMHPAAVAGCP